MKAPARVSIRTSTSELWRAIAALSDDSSEAINPLVHARSAKAIKERLIATSQNAGRGSFTTREEKQATDALSGLTPTIGRPSEVETDPEGGECHEGNLGTDRGELPSLCAQARAGRAPPLPGVGETLQRIRDQARSVSAGFLRRNSVLTFVPRRRRPLISWQSPCAWDRKRQKKSPTSSAASEQFPDVEPERQYGIPT